jgi:hypothetical protein
MLLARGTGVVACAALLACASGGGNEPPHTARPSGHDGVALVFAPPPADNPLRGLVPYVTADARDRFPHSLEFDYFALSDLMVGPDRFRWDVLEESLRGTSARGMQAVVRVFLEYPGRPSALPRYLVEAGLATTRWSSEENGGGESVTPDYTDPRLRQALTSFLAAFGARYDGDPRIGFVQAGLLGSWGEWHTYPRTDLWAPLALQEAVLDAYEAAFTRTPVLLRYPAGEDDELQANNAGRAFGYHDDSFAWATLDTGREEDSWYFVPLLRAAGAFEAWRTRPIGGEIRPELWPRSFTASPHPDGQDFTQCVAATHVSWLLDSGLFSREFPLPAARRERALAEVAHMGYVLHVARAAVVGESTQLELVVENRGVAPFYADWPVALGVWRGGELVAEVRPDGCKLNTVHPADELGARPTPVKWSVALDPAWRGAELALRVPNPMPEGKPVRFANAEQDGEWLRLPVVP